MDKKQPGTMLYFDIRPCLKRLSTQEKGELFEAILDYGEFGVVPELDGALGVAWDFIQPRLDRDRERYGQTVFKRKYAAYVREVKRKGETPLSFDDWKTLLESDDDELDQVTSCDVGCYPTAKSKSTSSSSPTITTATTTATPTSSPSTTPTSTSAPTSTPTGGRTRDQEFEEMRRKRMGMLK